MKKVSVKKDILYISISSFILVVLWVGFNIYHSYVTSTISPDLQLQIVPIEPTFNANVIQRIKPRKKVSPIYELKTASSETTITPTPALTETPLSSQSATPSSPETTQQLEQ